MRVVDRLLAGDLARHELELARPVGVRANACGMHVDPFAPVFGHADGDALSSLDPAALAHPQLPAESSTRAPSIRGSRGSRHAAVDPDVRRQVGRREEAVREGRRPRARERRSRRARSRTAERGNRGGEKVVTRRKMAAPQRSATGSRSNAIRSPSEAGNWKRRTKYCAEPRKAAGVLGLEQHVPAPALS